MSARGTARPPGDDAVRVADVIAVALRMHEAGLAQVCRPSGADQEEEA